MAVMMEGLFATFIICAGFITFGEAGTCYDATGPIENGQLNCRLQYNSYQKLYNYFCTASCRPGYQSNNIGFSCREPGRSSKANRPAARFTGTWSADIKHIKCLLPTTCPSMGNPRNGRRSCTEEDGKKMCTRICDFPFVPSEAEHVTEHCGPDTNFFWSYVLRNNVTSMPPCVVRDRCDNIDTTLTRNNSVFACKDYPELRTKVCKFKCDYGYYATNDSMQSYCGPSTGFIWSSQWVEENPDVGYLAECKKAPITVEVLTGKLCNASEDRLEYSKVYEMQQILDRVNRNQQMNTIFKRINWQRECVPSSNGSMITKYHFNIKDKCVDGTCYDACNALPVYAKTKTNQCRNMCQTLPMNKVAMLNQMRNLTLNYISSRIYASKADIASVNYNDQFIAMRVVLEESKYQGIAFSDKSPFCRSN